MPRGFILQPTYRIEAGRPVVHLYGTLESGASFLVRDMRSVPHFWIRRVDAERARELGAFVDTDERVPRRTMRGDRAARVEVAVPPDVPPLRDRLLAEGIPCYEADVRFASRYLMEHRIRGAVEIDGTPAPGDGIEAVFEDPAIRAGDWTPTLSVLSIDIETDPGANRLLSIALYGAGAAEVLLLTGDGMTCPPTATACPDEASMLRQLVRRVREIDPDVLTGWNVVDFDLTVLDRIADARSVPLTLGRGPQPLRLRPSPSPRGTSRATVEGRLVMDGIDLLRGAFVKLESYALNNAAREIVGKTKTITGPDRAAEILDAFAHDRPRLVEYNLHDARLVIEILEKLRLVELSVERSRLTGLPPDRVAGSIAAFDFLYLSELSRRGVVAPSVQGDTDLATQSGGHVLDPVPGLHRDVMVLDFKSLYPSIIRTFQIDPLGHAHAHARAPATDADAIVAPNGARFAREPGILPRLIGALLPRREAAKAAGDETASQAIKILMNSFYGVLGTSACRFAAPELANAITGFGREILLWTKALIEERGHAVLYGDTDSLFVQAETEMGSGLVAKTQLGSGLVAKTQLGSGLVAKTQLGSGLVAKTQLGSGLVAEINAALAMYVRERWGVESHLEIELDRVYLRLLLPIARQAGGGGGARKRYAGLVADAGGGDARVEFVGMEAVRRDWTDLARRVQRELYERLFRDRPVDVYLAEVVARLRAGAHDGELVYRKALRRALETYTKTTPPHVAAARKMSGRPGRVVRFVITTDGPEPAGEVHAPIDHEHYVQKQVRPIAEPVLTLLGLDFDRVIGDERQLRLF